MKSIVTAAAILVAAAAAPALAGQPSIIVGGNQTGNIRAALDILGYQYTFQNGVFPTPGSADLIIVGQDGGSPPNVDYTASLNQGFDVIFCGGSGLQGWADWTSNYFNNTYTGWQTDGPYHTVVNNAITQYLPNSYAPEDNRMTFHMMHFQATQNTTLYARNDLNRFIGAVRDYDNFGSFNYMAMDLGPYGNQNDINNFHVPFFRGAIEYSQIPAPGAATLLGVAGLAAVRRRR